MQHPPIRFLPEPGPHCGSVTRSPHPLTRLNYLSTYSSTVDQPRLAGERWKLFCLLHSSAYSNSPWARNIILEVEIFLESRLVNTPLILVCGLRTTGHRGPLMVCGGQVFLPFPGPQFYTLTTAQS